MKKLLLIFTGALYLLFSCSGDIAEDGTKRGALVFAADVKNAGQKYYTFLYLRSEEIDGGDGPTLIDLSWIHYTVNASTGKPVFQSTTETTPDEVPIHLGSTNKYSYFLSKGELQLLDHFSNGEMLSIERSMALFYSKNPGLKNKIANIKSDNYGNLNIVSKQGEIYLLNFQTMRTALLSDETRYDPDYQFIRNKPLLGEIQLMNALYSGYVLDDNTTLILTSLNESNNHKRQLYFGKHDSRKDFFQMMRTLKFEPVDETIFLDGYIEAQTSSTVVITYQSELGDNGKEMIGVYDFMGHRFLWTKPVKSLYDSEESSGYEITWNSDGSAFLIKGTSNEYCPASLVDIRTGKINWKF